MRDFLHIWVQGRDHRSGAGRRLLKRGEGGLHCHTSGLPSHPMPHLQQPTPASGSDKEDTAHHLPQPMSVPAQKRIARRPGLTPWKLGESGPSTRSYRRTTSDSSSWPHGHILGKWLRRQSMLTIQGISVL